MITEEYRQLPTFSHNNISYEIRTRRQFCGILIDVLNTITTAVVIATDKHTAVVIATDKHTSVVIATDK